MVLLITGIANGIGKEVAEIFIKQGHKVYGIDIQKSTNRKIISYQGDITQEKQLLMIKEQIKKDNIRLDAILNFAGIHRMGSLIEENYENIRRLLEINLLGTILVNKIFYDLLDEKGRIVITTSEVANLDPMPFNGIYHISKTALDCYSQSLRQELNLKNQKVITIRPGAVQTSLCDGSLIETTKLCQETKLYQEESKHFLRLIQKFMGKPMSPSLLAQKIYKISLKKHPKYIYNIHHNMGLVLLNILPKRCQCAIIKFLLKR